jgi:hypothetical protein
MIAGSAKYQMIAVAILAQAILAQVAMRAGDGFDGRAVIAAAKWYGGCRP